MCAHHGGLKVSETHCTERQHSYVSQHTAYGRTNSRLRHRCLGVSLIKQPSLTAMPMRRVQVVNVTGDQNPAHVGAKPLNPKDVEKFRRLLGVVVPDSIVGCLNASSSPLLRRAPQALIASVQMIPSRADDVFYHGTRAYGRSISRQRLQDDARDHDSLLPNHEYIHSSGILLLQTLVQCAVKCNKARQYRPATARSQSTTCA
jgi:hypothetical protein